MLPRLCPRLPISRDWLAHDGHGEVFFLRLIVAHQNRTTQDLRLRKSGMGTDVEPTQRDEFDGNVQNEAKWKRWIFPVSPLHPVWFHENMTEWNPMQVLLLKILDNNTPTYRHRSIPKHQFYRVIFGIHWTLVFFLGGHLQAMLHSINQSVLYQVTI